MSVSIYQNIKKQSAATGFLPEDFSIHGLELSADPYVRDGARDAILLYHGKYNVITPEQFVAVFQAFAEGDYTEGFALLESLFSNSSVIESVDLITDGLKTLFTQQNPYPFLNHLIRILTQSRHPEMIKFALIALENTSLERLPHLKQVIKTLALSDEFTFFCSIAASNWPNSAKAMFEMARNVRGWGRTMLIPRLDLLDREVNLWLLEEGYKNTARADYSATDILARSILPTILKDSDLDEEHFQQYTEIFLLSLESNPLLISFEDLDPELQIELTRLWLNRVEQFALNADTCEVILQLADYYQFVSLALDANSTQPSSTKENALFPASPYQPYAEQIQRIIGILDNLIDLQMFLGIIQQEKGDEKVFEIQEMLGMPTRTTELLEQFREDVGEQKASLRLLLEHPDHYQEAIRLVIDYLPLNQIAHGPNSPRPQKRLSEAEGLLCEMLNWLRPMPWQGRELILAGLQSSSATCRLSALITLVVWLRHSVVPLRQKDPELHNLVSVLRRLEQKPLIQIYLEEILRMYVRKK